jgi:hypothetical protein
MMMFNRRRAVAGTVGALATLAVGHGDGARLGRWQPDQLSHRFGTRDLSAAVFFGQGEPRQTRSARHQRLPRQPRSHSEGTPDIVTKSGVEGLRVANEVETANALVAQLQAQGVQAIVVLLHEGGVPTDPYNCTVMDPAGNPRLFTSESFGRLVTDVHLLLNRGTHDIVGPAAFAQNRIVTNTDVQPDAGINALIDKYRTLVAPISNRVIGHINGATVISRTTDADGSGDSPLGNLIADAQRPTRGAAGPRACLARGSPTPIGLALGTPAPTRHWRDLPQTVSASSPGARPRSTPPAPGRRSGSRRCGPCR